MTATPLREDNRDTYLYFGNPIYQYSLRQGIEDGFLAPYRVHRVITQWDAAGWRPSKDDIDRYGRRIPDEVYGTPDFERKVALLRRTEAIFDGVLSTILPPSLKSYGVAGDKASTPKGFASRRRIVALPFS